MTFPLTLSRRLAVVAELIGQTACLADVGCDHGKLGVYCLQTEQARKVIAIDVSAPSLDKARRLAEECDVPLDARLGNGLEPLQTGEADTVAIAGMGGLEIARILAMAVEAPPTLVLMPHQDGDIVARYLSIANYTIEHDFVVADDGRWYRAMLAHHDGKTQPVGYLWQQRVNELPLEGDWYVGTENRYNNDYAMYRMLRMRNIERIFRQSGGGTPRLLAEWHNLERVEYESD